MPGLTAVARLLGAHAAPCKHSCCIPIFLFCGAACRIPRKCSLTSRVLYGMLKYIHSYTTTGYDYSHNWKLWMKSCIYTPISDKQLKEFLQQAIVSWMVMLIQVIQLQHGLISSRNWPSLGSPQTGDNSEISCWSHEAGWLPDAEWDVIAELHVLACVRGLATKHHQVFVPQSQFYFWNHTISYVIFLAILKNLGS